MLEDTNSLDAAHLVLWIGHVCFKSMSKTLYIPQHMTVMVNLAVIFELVFLTMKVTKINNKKNELHSLSMITDVFWYTV